MSEEDLIAGRTQLAFDQWPTLKAAYGCVNCEAMFKEPSREGTCPHCNSTSVFDVAAALAVERVPAAEVVGKAKAMIERIDAGMEEEISGEPV